MAYIETNIRYLPLPYQCAIEMLDTAGDDRTAARLNGFFDHFERAYGINPASDDALQAREGARAICARRFWNYQP